MPRSPRPAKKTNNRPRVRACDLVETILASDVATKIENGEPVKINGIVTPILIRRGPELIFCDGLRQPVKIALAGSEIKIDKIRS